MATFTPRQRNWMWCANDDAQNPTALGAENAQVTLANNTNIIRLRINVAEIGGKADTTVALALQYSTNSDMSSPTAFGAAPAHWNYANGLGTEGSAVTTLKLTDTSGSAGEFCESGTNSTSVGASSNNEDDFAIVANAGVSGSTTYYFQVVQQSTALALDTGESYPNLITAAVNNYTYPDATGGGSNWVSGGGVSTLFLDIDPDSLNVPWAIHSVGDETYTANITSQYLPETTGGAAFIAAAVDVTPAFDYEYAGDVAGSFTSDYNLVKTLNLVGGVIGSYSVGEDTYTASLASGTAYVPDTTGAAWTATGGVSTLYLDIDPDGLRIPWAAAQVGDSTYTASVQGPVDYTYEADPVAFTVDHPCDYWVAWQRDTSVLWAILSATSDVIQNTKVDAQYTGDVVGAFTCDTDHIFVGQRTIEVTGDVAGTFASESAYGIGYAPGIGADEVVSAEAELSAILSMAYVPEVGVEAFLTSGFNQFYDLIPGLHVIVEEGATWGSVAAVSRVSIQVRNEDVPIAVAAAAASEIHATNLYDIVYESDATGYFAVGEDTLTPSVGAVVLEGDVAAMFTYAGEVGIIPFALAEVTVAAEAPLIVEVILPAESAANLTIATEYGFNISAPTFAADVAVNVTPSVDLAVGQVFDQPDVTGYFAAVSEVERSANIPLSAAIVGDVAGMFAFSADIDRSPVTETVVVFGVEGAVVYALTPPVTTTPADTTYVCGSKPGRGPALDGAWTETDQDGAWMENVGYAMSQGSEWGGYTQDDAYLAVKKSNVFPTESAKPSTTATDTSIPTTSHAIQGKPSNTFTDSPKPRSN